MTTDNKQVTDSMNTSNMIRVTRAANARHMPGWAHGYASSGLRCIPISRDQEKKPCVSGFTEPTCDADPGPTLARDMGAEMSRYKSRDGVSARNIAIVTGWYPGVTTPVWVLDIDAKPESDGRVWLAEMEAQHGPLPTDAMVHTPSGGRHYYWRLTPSDGQMVRGSVGQVAPGVDVRGQGGYAVAPGSYRADGREYRWHRDDLVRGVGLPLVDAPDWLLQTVREANRSTRSKPEPVAPTGYLGALGGSEDAGRLLRWAAPAIERLAAAQPGTRNRELNAVAYSIAAACAGEAVGASVVDTLRGALAAAADACGMDAAEAERTLDSGWSAGSLCPQPLPHDAEVVEGGWRDDVPPAEEEVAATRPARSGTTPPPVGGDEEAPPVGRRHKPIIVASGLVDDQAEVVSALDKILLAQPSLYGRGGRVVMVDAEDRICAVSKGDIVRLLTDAALWVRRLPPAKGETECRYLPLDAMPEQIVTLALSSAARLRQLDAVRTCPYYAPSGRLVVEQGYDAETRTLLLHTLKLNTGMSVAEARRTLDGWCAEFPYAAPEDRTAALGYALLPLVRDMVAGPTPLHLFNAPASRTGKTLLAQVLAIPALGRPPSVTIWSPDAAEQDKRLNACLEGAATVCILDNVGTYLGGDAIEGKITAEEVSYREMRTHREVTRRNRTCWAATSNNARTSRDMVGRVSMIRLDSRTADPSARTFSRDEKAWTLANRERLLSALVSLVERWAAAGRPGCPGRLGGFESWVAVVGGILAHAGHYGVADVARRRSGMAELSEEDQEWSELVGVWGQTYGTQPVTVRQVYDLAAQRGLLLGTLAQARSELAAQQVMGRALTRSRDVVYGDWQVGARFFSRGTPHYRLISLTPPAPAPAPTDDRVRPPSDSPAPVPAAAPETARHAAQAAPPSSPTTEAPSAAGEAPVPAAVHPDAVLHSAGLRLDPLPPLPTQGGEIKGMRLSSLPPLTPAIRAAVEQPVWRSEEQVALPWDGPGPVDEGTTLPASDPWASPGRSSAPRRR